MRIVLKSLVVLLLVASTALGAERRAAKDVAIDELIEESQKTLESDSSFNLVWIIPIEFWEASAAQDDTMTDAVRTEIINALDDYLILGVIRADIGPFGAFNFHGREQVLRSFTVTYVDPLQKQTQMQYVPEEGSDAALVLQMIRPILSSALGNMGQNFHLFLVKDRTATGSRIAPPFKSGSLKVRLAKLGRDPGGAIEWKFPLDSLMVARLCTNCGEKSHTTWKFCPFCGTKLPE